jgi:outer membrane protein assembly factor BamD (BamD/ComL family)
MKRIVAFAFFAVVTTWMSSCQQAKPSETDYFGKANQYMEQQNWTEAEANFLALLKEYPDGMFADRALFMVGYLNANHLKNLDKAREYYTKFIEKYPDHELVTAAKYELETLGKDPDELPFLKENGESGAISGAQQNSKAN